MKYAICFGLMMLNNEILSWLALLAAAFMFVCDILKSRLERGQW
jgi:hypothetical protein